MSDRMIDELVEVLQRNSSLSTEEANFMAAIAGGFAFSSLAVKAVMITRFRAAAEEAMKMLGGVTKKSNDDPSPASDGGGKKVN